MAGVSIPAAFLKLLPKWIVVFGLVLAVIGELSAPLPYFSLFRF
jgi:hypothetical protein